MRLVMIGASGHGKVCAEIAEESGRYGEIVFLDDNTALKACGVYPVVGTTGIIKECIDDETEFFVSIGDARIRGRIQGEIEDAGGRITTLIHRSAVVSRTAAMGVGSVVMAGAFINADAQIGKGVIINTAASVDHDCVIGDFCHVAVGAHVCGSVNIGAGAWIGAGAVVSNNVRVCDECIIGAGGVVVKDIENAGTYVGVPVRRITS